MEVDLPWSALGLFYRLSELKLRSYDAPLLDFSSFLSNPYYYKFAFSLLFTYKTLSYHHAWQTPLPLICAVTYYFFHYLHDERTRDEINISFPTPNDSIADHSKRTTARHS